MRSIQELMNLSGRTVLITGGAGNIGRAMAEAVAELGANIVILDRDIHAINEVADLILKKHGINTYPLQVDLEKPDELQTVKRFLETHCESLDVLINNAAFVGTSNIEGWTTPFEQQSAHTWRRAIEVNLTAVFELTQLCTGMLKKSKHASVINVASIYGVIGPDMSLYENTAMGNPAAYAASKGGVIQLTRWLSTTLAPHIRVNAISPGGLKRGQPDVFQKKYITRTPLGRMGTEEDFKGITAYLASDLSLYVTGQNIMVDGGWTAW